jgi:hypothetical protein
MIDLDKDWGISLSDMVPCGVQEVFKKWSHFEVMTEEQAESSFTRKERIPPIIEALATVNIRPLGVKVEAKFSPHGRKFHSMFAYRMICNGYLVRTFHLPPMGANTLTTLKGVTLPTDKSSVGACLGGIRAKIDGVEVVQFVVETVEGYEYTYRYDRDSIDEVESGAPALLERVGDKYYLLEGHPPQDLDVIEHDWYDPVKEAYHEIMKQPESDGIIADIAGVAYKVKSIGDITIHKASCLIQDVIDGSQVEGCVDIDIDAPKPYHIIRERPDKVEADSLHHIDRVRDRVRPQRLYGQLGMGKFGPLRSVCRYGPDYMQTIVFQPEYSAMRDIAKRLIEECGSYTNYEISQRLSYDGVYRIGSILHHHTQMFPDSDKRRTDHMVYTRSPPPRGSPFRAWLYILKPEHENYIGGVRLDYYGRDACLVYEAPIMTEPLYQCVYGRSAPTGLKGRGWRVEAEGVWAHNCSGGAPSQSDIQEWLSSWRGDGIYGWFYKDRRYYKDKK